MENPAELASKDLLEPSSELVEIIKHPKLYFISKSLLFLIIIIERLVMLLQGNTSETIIYFLLITLLIPVCVVMEYVLYKFMCRRRTSKPMQMIVNLLIHIICFEILIECSLQMFDPDQTGQKNILRSNILFLATLTLFFIESKFYRLLIATYVITINFFRISSIPSTAYTITWAVMEVILLISALMLWISDSTDSKKQLPEKLQKEFENFTQGLAVITLDGEILYMNGNFKGLMESDYEYEALDKILKLRRFDSYSEKARRKFLEEMTKNDRGASPYLKRKPSFRPREFPTRNITRNNTNTIMRRSGAAEKSIFESDKQSIVTFKESGDNLKVLQRQDSNEKSSYINIFNLDDNPVGDYSKVKTTPTTKAQMHRLLGNKTENTAKMETEHGLIPHEDSLQTAIEAILTNANENSHLKVKWDWLEPGKRWLNSFIEINTPAKSPPGDKSPEKDSLVSKVKVITKGLSGNLRLLEAQILPFQNIQNEGIFICLSDAMLETRLSDALEINEQKDRILRFVSHEFRTPLNCSLSVLEMLKNKVTTNLCKMYLEPALNSSKLLLSLVNDILDFAQIKAKKLRISVQACSLKKVIEEVIDMMQLQATAQEIDLNLEWDSEIPRPFFTDPNRVKQILLNLISNAFKFTPQGGSVTIKAMACDSFTVRFEVVDTGRGISQKNLEKLFEEFAKVQESSHLNPQGVGLGLVISRLLSQELGPSGSGLFAESELGKGTVFSFLLISKIEEATKHGFSNTNLDVMDISDDEHRARPESLLQKLQNEYGVIAQATKPAVKEDDIKVKISDFSTSIREIKSARTTGISGKTAWMSRQEPAIKTNRNTIVRSGTLVFKNAIEIEPIKLSALSQGSYVLSKIPIKQFNKQKQLDKNIRKPKSYGRSKTALGTRENGESGRLSWEFSTLVYNLNHRCACSKVLLVDDDALNLLAASLLLKNMDILSTSVVDGELAIQEVLKNQDHHSECRNYSIILMDVEMPRMDGFETTKILRRKMLEGEISFIPIIGITGHNPKEKKVDCLISGMNDMLIKPITPQILQEIMLKWVDDVDV